LAKPNVLPFPPPREPQPSIRRRIYDSALSRDATSVLLAIVDQAEADGCGHMKDASIEHIAELAKMPLVTAQRGFDELCALGVIVTVRYCTTCDPPHPLTYEADLSALPERTPF
jgi:hypothetical protein